MKLKFQVVCVFLILTLSSCMQQQYSNCYKGRLEDIPNCGAPVISILQGDLSRIEYETNWQNPATGENFSNVFVAKNYCDVQGKNLDPGDEFYFVVQTSMKSQTCVICMALFPVPSKTNIIKLVSAGSCQ